MLEHLTVLHDGIASIPPNYEFRTIIDSTVDYFSQTFLPLRYEVKVTFSGGVANKPLSTVQTLDLSAIRGVSFVRRKDIHDLVVELGRFLQEHKKISRATESIANS